MEEKEDKIRRQNARTTRLLVVMMLLSALFLWVGLFVYNKSNGSLSWVEGALGQSSSIQRGSSLQSSSSAVTHKMIQAVNELDAAVRKKKATGVIMENDPDSLQLTGKLQEATRTLLAARYGPVEPYRVNVTLEFQDTIPDFKENGPDGYILLEMAPSRLVPHSVFSFLEIARQWKGGAFHRIAGHVLQVQVRGGVGKPLAFQEYSEEYPHKERTVGYAGRPSGPAWYVSTQDNTRNHGRGSQQSHNPYEADSCFGRVIDGYDTAVQRIKKVPGKGFLNDKRKHVLIKSMTILVPGSGPDAVDGYVEWKQRKEL